MQEVIEKLKEKWINSGKTLPIEKADYYSEKWVKDNNPAFDPFFRYREAIPWYEQEISADKPMLIYNNGWVKAIHEKPCADEMDWCRPLTDAEIDALKRGF